MKFDVIIATFNRKKSLSILVNQLLSCSRLPEKIIIIDSSETTNDDIKKIGRVKYIKSDHNNQPYQRYVGYLLADSEVLVFLDDDMRVLDKHCFEKIVDLYNNEMIIGVQPNFKYIHNFFDYKMPKSKIRKIAKKNVILRCLKYFSGNLQQDDGKFWLAGIRGKKPLSNNKIEWFNGPIFSVKKSLAYLNFNFSLFHLYEMKIGKAEDAIFGFTHSRNGEIIYLEECFFSHDDQDDSSYSLDFISYAKRVTYSRLYLSLEYARLTKSSKTIAFLHFNLFVSGRIISLFLNQIFDYKSSRTKLLFGNIKGYFKALFEVRKLSKFENESYWKAEAEREIEVNSELKLAIGKY